MTGSPSHCNGKVWQILINRKLSSQTMTPRTTSIWVLVYRGRDAAEDGPAAADVSVLDASHEEDKVVMLVLQQARIGQKDVCDGPAAGSDRATKDTVAGGGTAGSRCSCRSCSGVSPGDGEDGTLWRAVDHGTTSRSLSRCHKLPMAYVLPIIRTKAHKIRYSCSCRGWSLC